MRVGGSAKRQSEHGDSSGEEQFHEFLMHGVVSRVRPMIQGRGRRWEANRLPTIALGAENPPAICKSRTHSSQKAGVTRMSRARAAVVHRLFPGSSRARPRRAAARAARGRDGARAGAKKSDWQNAARRGGCGGRAAAPRQPDADACPRVRAPGKKKGPSLLFGGLGP